MFHTPELTPGASVAMIDRLYTLLRKMAQDGWRGMRVREASKQEAEEEEAVKSLIALLRQLHAFRSEAISQVEAVVDGKLDKASTYGGAYAFVRNGGEIDIFDESITVCWSVYDQLRREANTLSVILGKSYSDLVAITLRPVFETLDSDDASQDFMLRLRHARKRKPDALRQMISDERDRLSEIGRITDLLTAYYHSLKEPGKRTRKPEKREQN